MQFPHRSSPHHQPTGHTTPSLRSPLLTLLLVFFLLGTPLFWGDDLQDVVILNTTDIHGTFQDSPGRRSFLKTATVIERLRRQYGSGRCLLIDCGGTVQGSPVAMLTHGDICLAALLALHYDAWIPGNHELDYGLAAFRRMTDKCRDILICGNLQFRSAPLFPAFRFYTPTGLRVVVVGANASCLGNWLLPEQRAALQLESITDMLLRILPRIMSQSPHLIILACHQGWFRQGDGDSGELNDIARRFPEVDLILGGHTHRLVPGEKIGPRTWYVQAAMHGTHVGKIIATVDRQKGEVVKITSSMVEVSPETEEHPALANLLHTPQAMSEAWLRTRISRRLPRKIGAAGRPGVNCPISEMLAQAMRRATGAEVAFHCEFCKIV